MNPVTLEFLRWVDARERTYAETMEAWQTSCPRHSAWEDSVIDGLVAVERRDGERFVHLTAMGASAIDRSLEPA